MDQEEKSRFYSGTPGLSILACLVFVTGGYFFFHSETQEIRAEKYAYLSAVGEQKAGQIASWRKERLANATSFSLNPLNELRIKAILKTDADLRADKEIRSWLGSLLKSYGFMDAVLVDSRGRLRLSVGDSEPRIGPFAKRNIEEIFRTGVPMLSDIHRAEDIGIVHLDLYAPLLGRSERGVPGKCVGVLMFRIDPGQFLYPLIEMWPGPSRTAETLLVRKDGADVVFLNKLRFRPEAALTLRIPLSLADVPAVQAALGKTGVFEGPDYRGVRVLSDIRPVPDTSWAVISKVDSKEVLSEVYHRGYSILIVVGLGVLLAGVGAALVHNVRQTHLYRSLSRTRRNMDETQEALSASEIRYRRLFEAAQDGILIVDAETGSVVDANPFVIDILGSSLEQVRGKRLWDIGALKDIVDNQDKFTELQRRGYVRYETLPLKTAEGRSIDVEFVSNVYEVAGQRVIQCNIRDITERKKAEKALKDSEVRYRVLFECARDPILVLEVPPEGIPIIRDANGEAVRVFGYTLDELRGQPISFLEPDGSAEALVRERRRGIRELGALRFETCHRRKDGSSIDVEIALSEITVGGKCLAISIERDITERKRAAALLKDKEERYRGLFDNMAMGVAVWEALDGGRDFRLVALNRAGEALTRVSEENVRGKLSSEAFPGIERFGLVPVLRRVHETGTLERFPVGYYEDPRMSRWFENTVFKLPGGQVVAIFDDRTEQRKAEADMNASHEMQGVLNEMLRESMANIPLREKFAKHLAALLSIPWLAVEPKGAVFILDGRKLVLTAHQGLPPALQAGCANVLVGRCLCGKAAEGGQVVTSESVGPDHTATYEGMLSHVHYCAPILAGGKTLGVLNLYMKEGGRFSAQHEDFIKAVTDIFAADILHARVEEQLSHSQKMDSVGRLAGGVAHDFNNLLTAINGYSGFLLEALAHDDPRRDDVKEIQAAGERAAGLTRQLLAFSRRQILNPQVVDLNAAVGGTVKILKRLIGEDIKLETRLATHPCLVKVDAGQLDQVLVNLAVNSRDAMPMGGTLTLGTEDVRLDEGFYSAHPELRRGPLASLSMQDTGCGMTDEIKGHLFEPFFTTKERGKGTGLGLSTAFGIIKQSGGAIEVESAPGKGTTFRMFFPLLAAGVQEKEKVKERDIVPRGSETILLVEDEEVIRRLGERLLSAGGYTVLTAANGPEALKLLERRAKPVDLVITDVVMPGMNGRDLARSIAKRNMTQRTLYISGYTDDAIIKHGVLEPGLAFLYKPFTPDALLLKLRAVLDGPADQALA